MLPMNKPCPPPHLNKETLIIWEGWSFISERKVAREAATKGTHVDLALLFLSQKMNLDPSTVHTWFTNEILLWVTDLLRSKQIFRANHILTNSKLDPSTEIVKIFTNTLDRELRNFLGEHLLKKEEISNDLVQTWKLLGLVEKYFDKEELTINDVNEKGVDWKSKMAAELYMKETDDSVIELMFPKDLWEVAISKNQYDLVFSWIEISFEPDKPIELDKALNKFLKCSPVTKDMLKFLFLSIGIDQEYKAKLYDKLASYGIFDDIEVISLEKIIGRLANSRNLHNLKKVLSKDTANLSLLQFLDLLSSYCITNRYFILLDILTKNHDLIASTKEVLLIKSFRQLIQNFNNVSVLSSNLLYVFNYIGFDDKSQIHSLILLFILIIGGKHNLYQALLSEGLKVDEYSVSGICKNLKVLKSVIVKSTTPNIRSVISFYEILQKHANLDALNLFNFRFNADLCIPHFNDMNYIEKFGYQTDMNYKFYLIFSRPGEMNKRFDASLIDIDNLRIFTIKKFNKPEITSSCISYLEMNNQPTDIIRIEIYFANLIYKRTDLQLTIDNVISLVLNEDKSDLLKVIQSVIISKIPLSNNGTNIVKAIKEHELIIKYANYYKLPLPDLLLVHLANKNLWLPFTFIIQKFSYTKEQVQSLVKNFNHQVQDHLRISLLSEIEDEYRETIMKERDSRKYFLSRIGVRQKRDNESMVSSTTSLSSFGSTSSAPYTSEFLEDDIFDDKANLLYVLIKCHNSNDPPKALIQACNSFRMPLLAIFATIYEPDSVVNNWLLWLSIMCDVNIVLDNTSLVGKRVSDFLTTIVERKHCKTLNQSFQVFLKDNPLESFTEFLCKCVNLNFDEEQLLPIMEKYYKALKQTRSNSYILELDCDMIYLKNKMWIESTALNLLAATIQFNFNSFYQRYQFLKLLVSLEVDKYFLVEIPSFEKMLQLVQYLFEKRIFDVHLDFIKLFDVKSRENEIASYIDVLLSKNMFDDAMKLCEIENMSRDKILIQKWEKEFESNCNNMLIVCNDEFKHYNLPPKLAIDFLLKFQDRNDINQYEILKLAYQWAHKNNLENEAAIEVDMWKSFFNLKSDDYDILPTIENIDLYTNILKKLDGIVVKEKLSSNHEAVTLDKVINYLLSCGNVYQAFRLEKLFEFKNTNLSILRACYKLVEKISLPTQLDAEERLLFRRNNAVRGYSQRRKTFLSSRLSSVSSISRNLGSLNVGTITEMEHVVLDIISLIENLIDGLTSGIEVGSNIFMMYRISINIRKSYVEVLESGNSINLLIESLNGETQNKLEVVHDFVMVYQWSKQEVADFLAEQIINVVIKYSRDPNDEYTLWDIDLNSNFNMILQLLPDYCSLLGSRLYTYANALFKAQTVSSEDPNENSIIKIVELLIRSHDCYTADCNMEGISVILKKCQTINNLFLTMKNWKLMVRLLTGIGRYNELNYVFHILRENDQFEFLLRKGRSSFKDNGLKIALLEYLKKFCPENRELYRMVALHFTLYSEVAQLWEIESKTIIGNLIEISKLEMQNRKEDPDKCEFIIFSNTDGTKLSLNKTMENYSHATEYHLQGEKLMQAFQSTRQAELIALQISLFKGSPIGTAICILNLNTSQISSALLNHLSFEQALILVEAYNFSADWAAIIFKKFILENKAGYLTSFLSHFPLSDTLVNDISKHFLSYNLVDSKCIENMKKIIKLLLSVHMKYKVASELGFSDLVEELINSNSLMYLKDTVWKKGYKN